MREAFQHKKALSAATLRARDPRPQRRRQSSIPDSRERRIDIFIIAHCIRFCILLLALAGLCGLGALIEEGMLSGRREAKHMALTIVLMLLGGVIGGCVGAFAVLIWADGLMDRLTAEQDVEDWADEALDAAPIGGRTVPLG